KYPGLYSFFLDGKTPFKDHSEKVWCKVCNKTVDFKDLFQHADLSVHKPYFRKAPITTPDVQSILDLNKGIFSKILPKQNKPTIQSETLVYCNPCDKKVSK